MLELKRRDMSTVEIYGLPSLINYVNDYEGYDNEYPIDVNTPIYCDKMIHLDEWLIPFFSEQDLSPQYAFIATSGQPYIVCYHEGNDEEEKEPEEETVWLVDPTKFYQVTDYKLIRED